MAPTANTLFPSLELIMNLVRSICNDSFAGATSTPGEGQILTDQVPNTTTNNPFVVNLLNSSIRELYRKLRITDALLIQDNYLWIGTPIVDGSLGSGIQDPSVQEWVDTTGWWNGTSYDNALVLPTDFYLPIRLWERTTGTTDSFVPMVKVANGLSARPQVQALGQWEYRNGAIYFVGSTVSRDVRLRYASIFPTFFTASMNFASTYIPVIDCEEFVAYRTAEKVSLALGNAAITSALKIAADGHLFDLKNERIRTMQQSNDFRRPGYNNQDEGGTLDEYGI